MSRNFLRRFLVCATMYLALIGHGFLSADVNWADGSTVTKSNSAWDTTLNILGDVTVNGDVYICSRNQNTTVNVTTKNSTIKPTNTGNNFGHLIFYADPGKTTNVNCDFDMTFTGNYGTAGNKCVDMVVTFSGQGTTVFNLKDYNSAWSGWGAFVTFTGSAYGPKGSTVSRAGTRVYVTMDQTSAQAQTNGINKVVFQRKSYSGTATQYQGYPTGVIFGPASFLTYISTNPTGLAADPNTNGDFASIAFDPTHAGKGRMVLQLDDALTDVGGASGNFNDAGLIIAGHFVTTFTSESEIRKRVYLNTIAGQRAIFRVIDGLAYNNATKPYSPDVTARRGLLVINKNTTVPQLAVDPYLEYKLWPLTPNDGTHPAYNHKYWANYYSWYKAPFNNHYSTAANMSNYNTFNVQTGFILGYNGWMDVYHNTFLDYVDLNKKTNDAFALEDISDKYTGLYNSWNVTGSPILKSRNPAAFVIDGLNDYSNKNDFYPGDVTKRYGSTNGIANSSIQKDAKIVMYGSAGLYFRCGVDKNGNNNYGPFFDVNGDIVYTFSIDAEAYNGDFIPSAVITAKEGEPVFDLEGRLEVWTKLRNDAPARSQYGLFVGGTEKGLINLPTVAINSLGQEVDTNGNVIYRPLTLNTVYQIYNSPSFFMNSVLELYNSQISHTDVLKPTATSPAAGYPAIVGGEAVYLNNLVWGPYNNDSNLFEYYELPKIRFYNSDMHLHEFLAVSGARLVVRELRHDFTNTPTFGATANNTSMIKFYDHGDKLDTLLKGFGRVLMLSCSNNLSSNGSSNPTFETATMNVYRNTKAVSPNVPASIIKLSLQNGEDANVIKTPLINANDQTAHHLVMLNRSTNGSAYLEVGWTTTLGDNLYYPWEVISKGHLSEVANQFSIDATYDLTPSLTPATLSIDGNYILFSGINASGAKPTIPVVNPAEGSIIYVDHGGRISVTQPLTGAGTFDPLQHGYETFIDTQIAYSLWNKEGLSGIVDLPNDQVIYGAGYGKQPYGVDTSKIGGNLNVICNNTIVPAGRINNDKRAGADVTIAWRDRAYDHGFVPVKNTIDEGALTRYTAIVNEPVTLPSDLLYFGANDWVRQLKISGATLADPIHILVSGNASTHGYAKIDEVVSIASVPPVPGEGQHSIIFLNNSGSVGLGAKNWSSESINAWNLLGKDYVTIAPDGNGTVVVNNNLLIVDRGAIVPTTNFGNGFIGPNLDYPRISFVSPNDCEITIPAYGEFNLSAFGQQVSMTPVHQEIEMGGKLRLIFEPGSTLRFPTLSVDPNQIKYPVLYLNDDVELVFKASPERSKNNYSSALDADSDKIKIMGCGQIWINKNAKVIVEPGARVGVVTDNNTPTTDLTISIQREGQFLIGDTNNAGGSFEVGNISDQSGSRIGFKLVINGPESEFYMGREAFFGLAVGIINKENLNSNPNGEASASNNPDLSSGTPVWNPDTTSAWQVMGLSNVYTVTIKVQEGMFTHANIFDGSSEEASLMAIGPLSTYNGGRGVYTFEATTKVDSLIRGGGNLMYLATKGIVTPVNAWDYNDLSLRVTTSDMYGILGSADIITQETQTNFTDNSGNYTSLVTYLTGQGQNFITMSGGALDFFNYLRYPNYSTLRTKYVCIGRTQFDDMMGYVYDYISKYYNYSGYQIIRNDAIPMIGEGIPEETYNRGSLGADGTNSPVNFVVVGRK